MDTGKCGKRFNFDVSRHGYRDLRLKWKVWQPQGRDFSRSNFCQENGGWEQIFPALLREGEKARFRVVREMS
jgi:hypothetical protein